MAANIDQAPALTHQERALLTLAQSEFPLCVRPFAALGQRLGISEQQVTASLQACKTARLLRRIGPVFAPRALGLVSELIAAEVAPEHLEAVGTAASGWGPVTHCYAREHTVNLWLAVVAPGSGWLETAAHTLRARAGVRGVWRLPALQRFKIGVHFDLVAGRSAAAADPDLPSAAAAGPGHLPDASLVSALEADLPLQAEPFGEIGRPVRLSGEEVIAVLQGWRQSGLLRRYGALVSHLRLGFTANAMTVWQVPWARVAEVGRLLAGSPAVSHCYERPPFPGFPWNLYAMIHGRTRDECLQIARTLSQAARAGDPLCLFSTREFGKRAPAYGWLLAARNDEPRVASRGIR